MKDRLHEAVTAAVRRLLDAAGDAADVPSFTLEVPRQAAHGDFACNAALLLAKRIGRPPREVAERLRGELGTADGLLERSEIAGPGFLNLWLRGERWLELLREILRAGPAYGRSEAKPRRKVQVEFVSANPTGPLTLGHGRQAVLGDCIARLLEASGHDVTREYYFNDGGRQMRVLGESVKARYLEQLGRAAPPSQAMLESPEADWPSELEGLPVAFPKGGYQGGYIAEIAAALRDELDDALIHEPAEGRFREAAERRIFDEIRATLDSLGVRFDVYFNEKSLYDDGKIEETLSALREKGLAYEKDGAVWLEATKLGLDRDRVIVKRTGEPTYLLPDIAYHREKFRRGFDLVIDVQGADHIEQFPFVRAAAGALGCDPERIHLVMHQFVTLTRDGQQVKQSTRRATYVTVDELVAEVGVDVFRFFMIERKADGHLDFDVDLAAEKDWKKNPAYYVQYAHARTHGIERKAREAGVALPTPDAIDAERLSLPEELALLKKLREYPDVVARAAETSEPHHVAYYLRDLAREWNPYVQDGVRHRVLSDDPGLTNARLGLVLAVRTVLANGLGLLGLSAPEHM
ncbi:MAG TPA: arginine--tRNA ligase [Myxococcota bacterium]|jgi:arginyl-tRNA synthetase|nr:arginine--tRNA ligase [Myxococcota bacterium]